MEKILLIALLLALLLFSCSEPNYENVERQKKTAEEVQAIKQNLDVVVKENQKLSAVKENLDLVVKQNQENQQKIDALKYENTNLSRLMAQNSTENKNLGQIIAKNSNKNGYMFTYVLVGIVAIFVGAGFGSRTRRAPTMSTTKERRK